MSLHSTAPQVSPESDARRTGLPAFDESGYLIDVAAWSEALARQLAFEAGVPHLGEQHWRVIGIVRERFFALGSLPVMRLVCRASGIDPSDAHRLFASCSSLWRIAGLPHPGEEALAYMN